MHANPAVPLASSPAFTPPYRLAGLDRANRLQDACGLMAARHVSAALMRRETRTASEILDGLRQDMLWLLITIHAFVTRAQFERLRDMSREEFAHEAVLLDSASRDIVLRLTALDDDTRGNRSFQSLFTALKIEGLDQRRARHLDQKVKAYRRIVNVLKTAHRNAYIAHVGTEAVVKPRVLDEPMDFSDAASAAVDLLDNFAERRISYVFSAASDLKIDLRLALAE